MIFLHRLACLIGWHTPAPHYPADYARYCPWDHCRYCGHTIHHARRIA